MRKQICLLIGALALVGVITSCGSAESAKSLGKKSESEDDAAQFFKLGMEYWSSGDTPKATEANLAAIECFREAAEQGHASGQFSLGFMLYHHNEGIQTDYSEAAKWFQKAAEQGHARACFKIGWMYEHGEAVPEDKDKAGKWFLKAAEQGHAKSQVRLAELLDAEEVIINQIEGIVDEEVEAAKWFRKAAEQGNGLAQMRIGDKYYHGTGVPQNDVEAYAWFLLAKARGYNSDGLFGVSDEIKKLEERMTSNQRAQGQARALELHKTIRERLDELQKRGIGNEDPY